MEGAIIPSAHRTAPPVLRDPARHSDDPASREIRLELGDLLIRIPSHYLKPGPHDPKRELRFRINDLFSDISRGRATVPLSRIVKLCPEIFCENPALSFNVEIHLPLQKLVEQIGILGPGAFAGNTAPPPVSNAVFTSPPAPPVTEAHRAAEVVLEAAAITEAAIENTPAEPLETVIAGENAGVVHAVAELASVADVPPPEAPRESLQHADLPAHELPLPSRKDLEEPAAPEPIAAPVETVETPIVPTASEPPPVIVAPEPPPDIVVPEPPAVVTAPQPAVVIAPEPPQLQRPAPALRVPPMLRSEAHVSLAPAPVAAEPEPKEKPAAPIQNSSNGHGTFRPVLAPPPILRDARRPLSPAPATELRPIAAAAPPGPSAPDPAKLAHVIAGWVGIDGCLILGDGPAASGGIIPKGFAADALLHLSHQTLGFVDEHPADVGLFESMAMHFEKTSLTLFARGERRVCVFHRERTLSPELRERIAAVAAQLG